MRLKLAWKLSCGLALAALGLAAPAKAQEWPARNVTIIVPFTAGGTADLFARHVANHFQQKFGHAFLVENRAGAGGNLGAAAVAKASPDGYTLLLGTVSTHAINPTLYSKLPFDAAKDFQPVSLIARLPNMLVVNPKIPAKTVSELITYLKANPDKISYGSSGVGTSIHLAAELFKIKTGTQMTHVPYRSSNEIMQNLTGGHIDVAFDNITLAWPQAKAGTLRALAVTSVTRSPTAPEVPTMADTLPGFEATSWHGLFAPAGTPQPIVDKMVVEMKRLLETPETIAKFTEIGAVPSPMTPAEFTTFIASEREKWAEVVKASGARVD
ncbi:tripartite tricarboxylate transporter substrate binding protein [Bradyrhizobium prioriisuperbiae]|uniref:Bug family tripartite tricarboxylate transporter substrate binding protein n=1 Tax=Bradyrhizobium prioriisuperbiae TaxID=2854389 RepID=UPI0028E70BC4|nr:tripartite tricarboxylate transporter substrate binding protein [Bradyrhizobium prioritasuperba]